MQSEQRQELHERLKTALFALGRWLPDLLRLLDEVSLIMPMRMCLFMSAPIGGHAHMGRLRRLWIIDEMISELVDATKTDEDQEDRKALQI